jgi:hypothetical protein
MESGVEFVAADMMKFDGTTWKFGEVIRAADGPHVRRW